MSSTEEGLCALIEYRRHGWRARKKGARKRSADAQSGKEESLLLGWRDAGDAPEADRGAPVAAPTMD